VLDQAGEHDAAHGPPALDVDAQPDVAVVDEDVVSRPQDVAHDVRGDGKVHRQGSRADGHLLPFLEPHRGGQVADPQLRPLKVGDQRQRPTARLLRRPHRRRPGCVLVLRAMREVEPRYVHARLDEVGHP
jgi:hypothetical protein